MLLSEDLRYLVEEEAPSLFDPKSVTDPEYSASIEISSEAQISASAEIKFVNLPEDQLDEWLDLAKLSPQSVDVEASEGLKVRTLHLLLLPVYKRPEYHTPFSNQSLRSVLALTRTFERPFKMISNGSTKFFQVPLANEAIGLIMRMEGNNERAVNSALMAAINKTGTQTRAVLRVMETESMDHFIRRITELRDHLWHPCILASLQMEARLPKVHDVLRRHKDNIVNMDRTAGVYKAFLLDPSTRRHVGMLKPWNLADFDLIRSELASVKNDLLYQRYKCDRWLELLTFLDEMASKIVPCCEWDIKSGYMRNTISGYRVRAQYLCDRAETTMQTCFSLMAQKDNYLNQRTAAQSLELTNLSRKDNETMKRIATATYRHSRDMRTITFITLCFLPATFVATFFSTSFFDFSVNGKGGSTWLWLYWVVTVTLTAVVMIGWYCFSRGIIVKASHEEDVIVEKELRDLDMRRTSSTQSRP